MEENKNKNEQVQQEGQSGQGGRRRRRRHKGGNRQNGQGQPVANGQGQQTASAQAQNTQPQNKPQAPKNNGQQNGQNGGQNQNGQGGKKNKNKQPADQNQNGNGQGNKNQSSAQKNQNGGGRDKNNGNKGGNKQEDNRKDTYLYILDGNLYVNLTNKCSNGCDFCVRNERTSYYGNYLWLRHGDPSAEKLITAAKGFGDLSRFKEVVFCGFGEPTYKMAEMLALCDYFHEKGLKTRLNTNGQGNLINKRDIVPELKGKIDFVNISLNASCYEKYQAICRSQFKEAGFESVVEFGKLCRRNGVDCRFSIVDCIGEDEVEACKRLAQSVNVPLYIRNYITDS